VHQSYSQAWQSPARGSHTSALQLTFIFYFLSDTVRSCVAKLFFSCPLKGHYCLYSKSSFTLLSPQPPLWIHIMFLFQQVCAGQRQGTSLTLCLEQCFKG